MKSYTILFIVLAMAAGLWSCQKDPVAKIPQISMKGFSTDSVKAGNGSFVILFFISDGDGDIDVDKKNTAGVYAKDLRFDTLGFVFYPFPETMRASMKATDISGTCYVDMPGVTMRADSVHLYRDTAKYEIYVKDLAGNESNHIFTPNLFIYR